jgi:alpha-galactosidase
MTIRNVCPCLPKPAPQPDSRRCRTSPRISIRPVSSLFVFIVCALLAFAPSAIFAQVNGEGHHPYFGWSSFSEQTLNSTFLTQANITAQSDALAASGLQAHGFEYINMDSGWQGSFDAYGRPIPNTATFPNIQALVAHIHQNGQKAGIYWIPGVEYPAVAANSPILGTPYHIQDILVVPYTAGNAFGGSGTSPYHYKIDYTKPGAQEYTNSVVALFAAWGIDLIKLDGVTPGSDSYNLSIDNRPDVAAWSKAIAASGRPIWLTISWALDEDYLSVWQQYANARRIDQDVECEGDCDTLTNWPRIYERFRDLPGWESASGPAVGWNDLDSLDIISPIATSGLTHEERRSALSLWALVNAPLILGGDLTAIDDFGKHLLSNDEVLAADRSTKPAVQVLDGDLEVWVSNLGNGTYYVGIFNMNATVTNARIPWSLLGFAHAAQVRDLWNHRNLNPAFDGFSTVLKAQESRLLKVTGFGPPRPSPSTSYEAASAALGGSASIASCPLCAGGEKVSNLGVGVNNTATFDAVYAPRAGEYLMQVNSMTIGLRSYLYSVNGGAYQTLNCSGGSFLIPASTTVPVHLEKGMNSIQFGSPVSYPPDLDEIIISGNGDFPTPDSTTYEAEVATLGGSVTGEFSNYSSGLGKAGNVGGGASNTVTFSNVTVPYTGTYQLEIDYQTSGLRSYFMTVNNGAATELDLNGNTFSDPTPTVIKVQLQAGTNTIQFGNSTGYSPDLDRIVIAPWIEPN